LGGKMRGLKVVLSFAACGFLLSFVAGLFSHTSILTVLLKALIFAVIFALLGFIINMVFGKFLSDGITEIQIDSTEGVSHNSASGSTLGQKVDIIIQDEELEKSESENHFVLGDTHQILNESDVRSKENEAAQEEKPGFVPLRNFETVKNFSGVEASTPDLNQNAADSSAASTESRPSSNSDNELDTLPEMDSFAFGEDSDSDSNDDLNVNTGNSDANFASSHSSSKKEEPEVKDAALMAKAISSVLSDENSL